MVADITYINGDVAHVYRDCIFYVHLCIPLAAACVYIYIYRSAYKQEMQHIHYHM